MSYIFPASLVTAKANLIDVFFDEAGSLGIGSVEAERLFKLLPQSIKSAPAIKFVFGPDWRYAFGAPIHLRGNTHGFGIPHQAPLVVSLVRATLLAERVLTTSQLRSWWLRLDNPAKHLDTIVEMLSVINVTPDHSLVYERARLGVGSYQIDWLLKTKAEGDFLLEVKNRPGQSAQELIRIQSTSRSSPQEPYTDFDALFKNTFSKFLPVSGSSCTQGVILFLGIKIPAARFAVFFHDHLETNLHFVALGKEDKESGICVNLLATSTETSNHVLSAFGWRENADLMA